VGLLGDTEGDQIAVHNAISLFAEHGVRTVLHLGDFYLGVGSERAAKKRLLQTDAWLADQDQTWLVTPGNHENWDRLAAKKPGTDGLLWFADHIAFIPRGHRWTWRDTGFVSLGGAPSINRDRLTEGRTWWPREQITDADVDHVIAHGYADVMLTHDAPDPLNPKVQAVVERNPHGWSTEALAYATEGRDRLTRAFKAVRPRLLVHGHHHLADRATVRLADAAWDTEIVSLSMAGRPRSAAVLDLAGGPADLRVTTL
jgi:hypothetical protein